jgi:pyruvate/2-oxoglutarate dehydrogenase complex dihydrolipoamide dehydrogenase (E3) component
VFDRATRTMVGAAMACPDASAAIHECVLAIRAGVPIEILAETIHAFPSTSRILNGLFADAARQLRD